MNKALVITVAGTSSRFRKSLGDDVLKCLYSEKSMGSILDRQILQGVENGFNTIVVVGGYRYRDLLTYMQSLCFPGIALVSVYNDKFDTWGSNYSLYLGLEEALKSDELEKVVFAEGDLVFDSHSFSLICERLEDVITVNQNAIMADTAVVFYTGIDRHIKYCYDPAHHYLEIKEPFLSIYNSGQVWSFTNMDKLRKLLTEQKEVDLKDTNLNIIQKYFNVLEVSDFCIITFKSWFNCNTVEDYTLAFKSI